MKKPDVNVIALHRQSKGSNKPFIDKDLQIQIPDLEISNQPSNLRTKSIYHHYCGQTPSIPTELEAYEKDLEIAISEAKQSHEAWKKIQAHIRDAAKV